MTRHAALVGATASGKTELALAAAQARGDVEIVSLDSMQVYRGMDVGTAKPTPEQRAVVRHHLVDVADPGEEWSVVRTQDLALAALADIEARGRRALFVGGTGLYVAAVLDGLRVPGGDPAVRAELMEATATPEGLANAYAELAVRDPVAAERIEPANRRRIVRALEVIEVTGRPFSDGPGVGQPSPAALPVTRIGVWLPRAVLADRIEARLAVMRDQGLVDEVDRLSQRPLSRTAAEAIGYRELLGCDRSDARAVTAALAAAARRTRRFARRQRVWFRRDRRIVWLGTGGNTSRLLPALLAVWSPT